MDIWWIMLFIILGVGVITIILIIVLSKMYNFRVRIREVTSKGTRLIHDTLARVGRDENKIERLILMKPPLKSHKFLPLPPAGAIDYNPKKKKKVIEVWWTADKGYTYIKDTRTGKQVGGFEPLTTKQRAMMVSELIKIESRKGHKWTENLPLIIGGSILIILLVVMLIFWGEALTPMMELGDKLNAALDKAAVIERINMGVQDVASTGTPP